MDCPVCKGVMITMELAEVEIDYCGDCGGIWLDAGELEVLMDGCEQAAEVIGSFAVDRGSKEKARKCPICLKKMEKVLVNSADSGLLIDRCVKGDGLWFDRGELTDILETTSIDPENRVVKLLSDMFGEEKA